MKTAHLRSACVMVFSAWISLSPARAEWRVHEWGTFTVLQDSTGAAVRWYQPSQDQHALPDFVHRPGPTGVKALADGKALARMETPVLYFYPPQEMNVMIKAAVPQGGLSEWFPDALAGGPVNAGNPQTLTWVGRLLSPSGETGKRLPHQEGAIGRHYALAREVPEAWYFQSHLPERPAGLAGLAEGGTGGQKRPEEVDRLIFYRGAADLNLPLRAIPDTGRRLEVTNHGTSQIPAFYALRTGSAGISWQFHGALDATRYEKGNAIDPGRIHFPEAKPLTEVLPELQGHLISTLQKQGLTQAEALAMVSTWQELWFREPGVRLLVILPQDWIHAAVPLQITPAPDSLVRVFVGRLEILVPEREQAFVDLLDKPGNSVQHAAAFQKLELGRFTEGALERALQMNRVSMTRRLRALQEFQPLLEEQALAK